MELQVNHEDELGRHTLLGRTSLELTGLPLGSKTHYQAKLIGGELGTMSTGAKTGGSRGSQLVRTGASRSLLDSARQRGSDGKLLAPAAPAAAAAPEPSLTYSVELLTHDAARERDAQLRVRAVQARGLPAMDVGGSSDPYLVARFQEDERRSSVVYRSLAPFWRETLTFDTSVREMGTVLEIECFDYDLSSQVLWL